MKTYTKIGNVVVGKPNKDGSDGGFYIKLFDDKQGKGISSVRLRSGQNLSLKDPREELQKALTAGRLSEDAVNEMTAKIPDYIKFEIWCVE